MREGITRALRYSVPDDDICGYLLGVWKRTLEWREFGPSFEHIRTSNSLVTVHDCPDAAVEPGTRLLDWCFGTELDDVKLAFTMQFFPGPDETVVEWDNKGVALSCVETLACEVRYEQELMTIARDPYPCVTLECRVCRGDFNPAAAVLSLSFRDDDGLVSNATYRILDANTMTLCLAEVDKRNTLIQYGHMCRLPESSGRPKGS